MRGRCGPRRHRRTRPPGSLLPARGRARAVGSRRARGRRAVERGLDRGRRVPRAAHARRRARLGAVPRHGGERARRPARPRSSSRRSRPRVQHAARGRDGCDRTPRGRTAERGVRGRVVRRSAHAERGRRALPHHARVLRPAPRHPARGGRTRSATKWSTASTSWTARGRSSTTATQFAELRRAVLFELARVNA